MEKRYIIGLDEGTTSCRCVVYDTKLNKIISSIGKKFTQYFPKPSWVEHDANEIWEKMLETIEESITKLKLTPKNTYGIGLTNQRESVVAWQKSTGKPVARSIVWQCRRTASICSKIGLRDRAKIRNKTGLIVDPYFSATKIKWLLENEQICKDLLEQDDLCIGTMDSYIVFKLTNGKSFVTDTTNASRTMLFNIDTLTYDEWLLNYFGIPEKILPKVVSSNKIVGEFETESGSFPIAGIIGDQQASLFGQACFNKGMAKSTYGTGCFILSNTGNTRINSKKMLSTIAWTINNKTTYAMEGSVFNAGSAIDWMVEGAGFIEDAKLTEKYASSIKNNEGVYLVPAFTGIGAPYWNAYSTGILTGITRGTTKAHIARAVLESMAYNVKDILEYMQKNKVKITELRVDGGVTKNNFLMQFQADMLNIPIHLPANPEITVLGAILMAGLGLGAYKSLEDIKNKIVITKTYTPDMKDSERNKYYRGWHKAVEKCLYKEKK